MKSIFKFLVKFLGNLSPAHILLFSATTKKTEIGTDGYGNTYYEAAPIKGYKRPRRWVMYEGEPEASKVPPEWHGWLHHQTNNVPKDEGESYRRPWQKPPEENRTGTNHAYRPPGHALAEGKRQKATGDYEAWTPEE